MEMRTIYETIARRCHAIPRDYILTTRNSSLSKTHVQPAMAVTEDGPSLGPHPKRNPAFARAAGRARPAETRAERGLARPGNLAFIEAHQRVQR